MAACAQVAEPKTVCFEPRWEWDRFVKTTLETLADMDGTFVELSPEQRESFIREWNYTGQRTGYQWQRIGWISIPDMPQGFALLGMENCVWYAAPLPVALMRQHIGRPA